MSMVSLDYSGTGLMVHSRTQTTRTAPLLADRKLVTRKPPDQDLGAARRLRQRVGYASGRTLPSSVGRLRREDYDLDAVQRVSWALGHNRLDVVWRHYLR